MDNLVNEFLRYQLHKEGADEANHAGPGVPDLCSLGEPQEGLAQLWLHPGHFNLNTTENEQLITVEKKLFFFWQLPEAFFSSFVSLTPGGSFAARTARVTALGDGRHGASLLRQRGR
jgi:hypothetical protein